MQCLSHQWLLCYLAFFFKLMCFFCPLVASLAALTEYQLWVDCLVKFHCCSLFSCLTNFFLSLLQFSDILVLTKMSTNGRYKIKHVLNLHEMNVSVTPLLTLFVCTFRQSSTPHIPHIYIHMDIHTLRYTYVYTGMCTLYTHTYVHTSTQVEMDICACICGCI